MLRLAKQVREGTGPLFDVNGILLINIKQRQKNISIPVFSSIFSVKKKHLENRKRRPNMGLMDHDT